MPAAKAMKKAMKKKAMKQKVVKKDSAAVAKSVPKKSAKKTRPPPAAPEPARPRWTRCDFEGCNRLLVRTKFGSSSWEERTEDAFYEGVCLNEDCNKKFKAGDTVWVCPRVGRQLRGLGFVLRIIVLKMIPWTQSEPQGETITI